MSKKSWVFFIVVVLAAVFFVGHMSVSASQDNSCSCNAADCMDKMERICENYGDTCGVSGWWPRGGDLLRRWFMRWTYGGLLL